MSTTTTSTETPKMEYVYFGKTGLRVSYAHEELHTLDSDSIKY